MLFVSFVSVVDGVYACTGPWSEDEHQKLCQLVLKCIHVKEQMKKMGIYTKTHKVVHLLPKLIVPQHLEGNVNIRASCGSYLCISSPIHAS